MVYADLHNHTRNSDGFTKNIVEAAKEENTKAVAVTDHHAIYDIEHPIVEIDGIDVISGIELRTKNGVELLGYGVERTDELVEFVEKTNLALNYNFTADEQLERSKFFWSKFDNSKLKSFDETLRILRDSCNFISLAHPYRYDKPEKRIDLAKKLDGIECEYPYHYKIDTENSVYEENEVNKDVLFAEDENLVITGGSDSHIPRGVGTCGITEEQYNEFLSVSGLK